MDCGLWSTMSVIIYFPLQIHLPFVGKLKIQFYVIVVVTANHLNPKKNRQQDSLKNLYHCEFQVVYV